MPCSCTPSRAAQISSDCCDPSQGAYEQQQWCHCLLLCELCDWSHGPITAAPYHVIAVAKSQLSRMKPLHSLFTKCLLQWSTADHSCPFLQSTISVQTDICDEVCGHYSALECYNKKCINTKKIAYKACSSEHCFWKNRQGWIEKFLNKCMWVNIKGNTK